MPLSKKADRERERKLQPNSNLISLAEYAVRIREEAGLDPDAPKNWYSGAEDHFGTVKDKRYAEMFFETLGSRDAIK